MPEILELAVESLRRERLLDATNVAYALLKASPKDWQNELTERGTWEATLADGQDASP